MQRNTHKRKIQETTATSDGTQAHAFSNVRKRKRPSRKKCTTYVYRQDVEDHKIGEELSSKKIEELKANNMFDELLKNKIISLKSAYYSYLRKKKYPENVRQQNYQSDNILVWTQDGEHEDEYGNKVSHRMNDVIPDHIFNDSSLLKELKRKDAYLKRCLLRKRKLVFTKNLGPYKKGEQVLDANGDCFYLVKKDFDKNRVFAQGLDANTLKQLIKDGVVKTAGAYHMMVHKRNKTLHSQQKVSHESSDVDSLVSEMAVSSNEINLNDASVIEFLREPLPDLPLDEFTITSDFDVDIETSPEAIIAFLKEPLPLTGSESETMQDQDADMAWHDPESMIAFLNQPLPPLEPLDEPASTNDSNVDLTELNGMSSERDLSECPSADGFPAQSRAFSSPVKYADRWCNLFQTSHHQQAKTPNAIDFQASLTVKPGSSSGQ